MNRWIVFLVLGVVALLVYRKHGTEGVSSGSRRTTGARADGRLPSMKESPSRFQCDGRIYCSQMHSRAEAEYFTRHCPGTRMDGDHDGIPCENDSRF